MCGGTGVLAQRGGTGVAQVCWRSVLVQCGGTGVLVQVWWCRCGGAGVLAQVWWCGPVISALEAEVLL